jgi:hypothetical protein
VQVLSSDIPSIQERYRDLQPAALAMLCQLLQGVRGALGGGERGGPPPLGLAARALRALRSALAEAARLPEDQGISSGAIVALLFDFVSLAAPNSLAGGGGGGEEAALEVAAAALDCATDLQAKYFSAQQAQQMLEALLPRLQARRGLGGSGAGRGGGRGGGGG